MLHEVKLVVNAREDFSNRLRHRFGIGKQSHSMNNGQVFERKVGSWDIMTPTLSWHLSQTTRHRGVGDHAAGTHDLGQIASGYHGRWLIIDAALESSGAPGSESYTGSQGKVCSIELLGMYSGGLVTPLLIDFGVKQTQAPKGTGLWIMPINAGYHVTISSIIQSILNLKVTQTIQSDRRVV